MTTDLLNSLSVHRICPNDVLVLPEDFDRDQLEELRKALLQLKASPCLVVIGDVKKLTESDMNALGWYRK
ncbi:hypothetical protein N5D79_18335 [Pseudomonas sp. GD03817]|uniref:hypothetical protein n=1 Tax=unclassified Pseudomonas TaxID=196821 RepID=UPI00244B4A41|nr:MULTISPECIES: hypothetical protein [unclassified Pseudomonas]MDH1404360.1 hypothetical protein [Pseudomonas sp. GD03730]MDH1776837.1 hypothetical protein [Pseudomonas sp. GD03817]